MPKREKNGSLGTPNKNIGSSTDINISPSESTILDEPPVKEMQSLAVDTRDKNTMEFLEDTLRHHIGKGNIPSEVYHLIPVPGWYITRQKGLKSDENSYQGPGNDYIFLNGPLVFIDISYLDTPNMSQALEGVEEMAHYILRETDTLHTREGAVWTVLK